MHRRSPGLHGQRRGGLTQWPHSQPCLGRCLPATGEGRHRSGRKGTCHREEEMAWQVLEGRGRDPGQSPQICQGFPHLLGGPCLSPGPRAAWKDPLPNGRQLVSAPPATAKHLTHSLEAVQHMGGNASPPPAFLAARRPLEGSSRAAMLQWLWEKFSAVSQGSTTSRLFPKGMCLPEAHSSLVPLLLQTHPAGSRCPTLRGGRADPHPPGHPALLPVHRPLPVGAACPGLLGESGVPCTD